MLRRRERQPGRVLLRLTRQQQLRQYRRESPRTARRDSRRKCGSCYVGRVCVSAEALIAASVALISSLNSGNTKGSSSTRFTGTSNAEPNAARTAVTWFAQKERSARHLSSCSRAASNRTWAASDRA